MQVGTLFCGPTSVRVEFPAADRELLPGVVWGSIEAFPTPAYWAYQVFARRLSGEQLQYKLGRSLKEEVAACLLGGHGIPAPVGIAAFTTLRDEGMFEGAPSERDLYDRLSTPLTVNGRSVRYRFAKQKSRFLSDAMEVIENGNPPTTSGKLLRDWLLQIKGVGPKTASWVARNWLDADDVAILDIHIDRACRMCGLFPKSYSIEKNYFELESLFIALADSLGVKVSELDAVIWYEMMNSPRTVRSLLGGATTASEDKRSISRPDKRRANTAQAVMFD